MDIITNQLATALRNLPRGLEIIEEDRDAGFRTFCCQVPYDNRMSGESGIKHEDTCWYVAAKRALALFDEQKVSGVVTSSGSAQCTSLAGSASQSNVDRVIKELRDMQASDKEIPTEWLGELIDLLASP